jgi:hypothetical protein
MWTSVYFNCLAFHRYSLIENLIFKIFIKYIHVFLCLYEWMGEIVTDPGFISPLSGPVKALFDAVHPKIVYIFSLHVLQVSAIPYHLIWQT